MSSAIPRDFTWETKITSYDVGPDLRLRLSSQLKLQQEVGELHLTAGGLAYTELYRHGIVFVLTRLCSVIRRAPVMGETVRLNTWHRENKGAQFFRCYRFTDNTGKTLIDSVSAFAIVDPESHKLLRPEVFERRFGITSNPERINCCPDPVKWQLPEGLAPVREREGYWSDLDCNDHLGNTAYPDIARDAVPGGLRGRRIAGFSAAFLREAREGDRLALSLCELPGESWVTGALSDGRPCFELRFDHAD